MTSLQKAVDMLADIGRRLDKLESGETLPLWMRGGSQTGASPSPLGMTTTPVLSKAVLGLPGGPSAGATPAIDPAAVLNDLLRDPVLGDYVRRKINEASF